MATWQRHRKGRGGGSVMVAWWHSVLPVRMEVHDGSGEVPSATKRTLGLRQRPRPGVATAPAA
ncbi:hypothetical protein E2C01_077966 [Portunus trituberculatus]|uniref:Uncharacterized protein n=1 Tax=Portunus trituberculatus TaxID=210409 RepID=A0A5B7ICR8_PORTR|nr:hypothetical protein [Portunus trituberculatus]